MQVRACVVELVAAAAQPDDDVVLFKSLGIAAEDLAVGSLLLERARERGLGVEL